MSGLNDWGDFKNYDPRITKLKNNLFISYRFVRSIEESGGFRGNRISPRDQLIISNAPDWNRVLEFSAESSGLIGRSRSRNKRGRIIAQRMRPLPWNPLEESQNSARSREGLEEAPRRKIWNSERRDDLLLLEPFCLEIARSFPQPFTSALQICQLSRDKSRGI